VLDQDPIVSCARAVLPGFVDEVGETFFLVGHRGDALVVLEKCEGSGLLRVAPPVGSTVPVDCTAVGALYMAHCAKQFPVATIASCSALTPALLDARVAAANAQGWSSNLELWQAGLAVLAAPVIVRNQIRGAVALAASAPRLAQLGGEALAPTVMPQPRQWRSACKEIGNESLDGWPNPHW